MQGRATRSDRAWEGVVKGTECLLFCLRADPGGLGQGGGHCLALLSLWLPRFSYKWLPCCPRLSGLIKASCETVWAWGDQKWSKRAFGGVLLPYSRKGSRALWIRASSRNLAFALGHEVSGRANPRGSPRRAAQGRCVSTLLQGRDSLQVFITR